MSAWKSEKKLPKKDGQYLLAYTFPGENEMEYRYTVRNFSRGKWEVSSSIFYNMRTFSWCEIEAPVAEVSK